MTPLNNRGVNPLNNSAWYFLIEIELAIAAVTCVTDSIFLKHSRYNYKISVDGIDNVVAVKWQRACHTIKRMLNKYSLINTLSATFPYRLTHLLSLKCENRYQMQLKNFSFGVNQSKALFLKCNIQQNTFSEMAVSELPNNSSVCATTTKIIYAIRYSCLYKVSFVEGTETSWDWPHYYDVIMGAVASQITSLKIVHSTVYSDADQRKHQSSASLAFVRGIHRWPVNSPHKWPVTRKMFPFDDVIMICLQWECMWMLEQKTLISHRLECFRSDDISGYNALHRIVADANCVLCEHEFQQITSCSWWRHQMETFSALLAICAGNSPGTGEVPTQRPVMRSFDVFFDLRLNKRLSKQPWGWWFETPSFPLWRHCNEISSRLNIIILDKMIQLFVMSVWPSMWCNQSLHQASLHVVIPLLIHMLIKPNVDCNYFL